MLGLIHIQTTHLLAQTLASNGRRLYSGYLIDAGVLRFARKCATAGGICVLALVLNTPATALAQDDLIDLVSVLRLAEAGRAAHLISVS